jgi:PAS domain-containing protein
VVAGFDIGAVDYISKPLRMAEVCARVRTQLQIRSSSETQEEQAERLRTIVNNMAEGLLIIEADGRIQFTNPACDKYLGYTELELAGRSITDLLNPWWRRNTSTTSHATPPRRTRRTTTARAK